MSCTVGPAPCTAIGRALRTMSHISKKSLVLRGQQNDTMHKYCSRTMCPMPCTIIIRAFHRRSTSSASRARQAPQAASAALKLHRCSELPAEIIGNPQAAYERHMPRNFQERNPALNTSADDWKPFLEKFLLLDAYLDPITSDVYLKLL